MWDQRYDTEEYVYGRSPNEFLAGAAGLIPKGGRVLCLAEGEGRNAVFLSGLGYSVLAVDSSAVGMNKARKLAAENNVTIGTQVADLAHLEIEQGAWDAVVSVFAHVPSSIRKALHRKVVRGLRPGGLLILEAYTPAQLKLGTGGPPDADKMMTLNDLREELAGLEFRHAVELQRNVVEGTLHTGRGAVVQVVAMKPGQAAEEAVNEAKPQTNETRLKPNNCLTRRHEDTKKEKNVQAFPSWLSGLKIDF